VNAARMARLLLVVVLVVLVLGALAGTLVH
jgi:hypothetical protein